MPETYSTTAAEDAAVTEGLGIGQQEDAADDETEDEVGQDQESEEVGAEELAELRREVAKLRREAAERRVREKQAKAKQPAEGSSTDIEAAREAGREEARAENGIELTTEAVRAALTGIIPDADLDEFVDELNISRFVTDEHKPDREAIAALKARQARLSGARKTARVNHGRSATTGGSKSVQQQFEDTFTKLLN